MSQITVVSKHENVLLGRIFIVPACVPLWIENFDLLTDSGQKKLLNKKKEANKMNYLKDLASSLHTKYFGYVNHAYTLCKSTNIAVLLYTQFCDETNPFTSLNSLSYLRLALFTAFDIEFFLLFLTVFITANRLPPTLPYAP
jgi:hypothetical protein